MKLGFVADSQGDKNVVEVLQIATRLGVEGIEINTRSRSTVRHFNLQAMLNSRC